MNHRYITVVCFGEPERGIWCETCLLPSALRFHLVGQDGMSVLDIGKRVYCPDCDSVQGFNREVSECLKGSKIVPKDVSDDYALIPMRVGETVEQVEATDDVTQVEPETAWTDKSLAERIGTIGGAVLIGLIAAFVLAVLCMLGWAVLVHLWQWVKP